MNEQEFAELAAGAALHALSPDDQQRYHAALAAHPEWQRTVDADAETAALLADAVAPVAPAPGIRAALLARIAETPQNGETYVDGASSSGTATSEPADSPQPKQGSDGFVRAAHAKRPVRPLRILFALAACLALLVGVGLGTAALNDYLNRPASVVALDDIRGADDAQQATVDLADGGTATAHWSASLGTAVLVADGIASLPDDETYELWFVRGDTPVSAGVFDAEQGGATALLKGDMHEGDVIAVTVEQAGGSPDGTPTSEPIVMIPTA
jgi:anti-sigma-K factor RskA